jgi:LmbE family N-acetylglucosaminyl deacetylase
MAHAPTSVPGRFVDVPVADAALAVAAVLDQEDADTLTGYDANGGYGHPDHVAVHHVARAAQGLARHRPVLLEATRDRRGLVRLLRVVRPLAPLLPGLTLPSGEIYADPADVRLVDVRDAVDAKRAALAAHASQATGGVRTVRLLLALPGPLARRVLGREWFVEVP